MLNWPFEFLLLEISRYAMHNISYEDGRGVLVHFFLLRLGASRQEFLKRALIAPMDADEVGPANRSRFKTDTSNLGDPPAHCHHIRRALMLTTSTAR
jgi:hypothetical protein